MTTIAEVRDALAAAITAGAGLRASAYQSDNINAPCAHVKVLAFDPRLVMDPSTAVHNFRVRVYTGRAADRASQKRLDVLRETNGDGSLRAAVENEDNWPDGLVQYVTVTEIGEQMTDTVADEMFLIVDFEIEVCF